MVFRPAQKLLCYKSEIDVCQEPYLRDHAFRGLAILPGAFYINNLAKLVQDSLGSLPGKISQISFERVFIIPEKGTAVITCELHEIPEGPKGSFIGTCQSEAGIHAKMRIALDEKKPTIDPHFLHKNTLHLQSNGQKIEREMFYRSLKASGNEYGHAFQGVSKLWHLNGKAFAIVSDRRNLKSVSILSSAILDACLQVLPAANNKTGRTFVLTSIGSFHFFGELLGDAHVFAEIENSSTTEDSFQGNLTVTNEDGSPILFMSGLSFQYLEIETSKPKVVISSTFTAEPMLEALQFWSKQLEKNWEVQFAPYNQVHQQLLDPSSLFGSNSNGINVVLLRLEDWFRFQENLTPRLNAEEQIKHFAGTQRYTLPNRLQVAHLNDYETQYLYDEIFKEKTYLKHGITLEDGACVFDIGANIGLFNLFVQTQVKNATIHSFEPSPPAYNCLKKNATLYGSENTPEDGRCKVKLHSIGISNETKELPFTFYPTSSVFSSYCPDTEEDEFAIRAIVRNTVEKSLNNKDDLTGDEIEAIVDQLMEGRLDAQTYPCQLRPLSELIREENIETIDLLKVDVEKAEWDVLCGIDDDHWQMIKQIVIEVHDSEGTLLPRVVELLESQGFQLSIGDEEELLTESGLYNIYGKRFSQEDTDSTLPLRTKGPEERLQAEIEIFTRHLGQFAERSQIPLFVVVCSDSPDRQAKVDWQNAVHCAISYLKDEIRSMNGVQFISPDEIENCYPVQDSYDPEGDVLGHVPYTREYFNGLATLFVRKAEALERKPYKVIVLDCDNTLWKGVVGEDEYTGIEINDHHRSLHEFMVNETRKGKILCLASKNTESDVWAVFDKRSEMVLSRDDIAAARINWNPKSENMIDLARELNLGLDSFIFLDDNPRECAEVSANCPAVTVLCLPTDETSYESFLKNHWVFDQLDTTSEDAARTKMYQQNAERENFRRKVQQSEKASFADFLQSLEMRIEIDQIFPDNLSRASQLTKRTNQFNNSTRRRTEQELREFLHVNGQSGFIVRVSDRFGDYGFVGLVLTKQDHGLLIVESFLLSCRVLGKGVEHDMLQRVGKEAKRLGVDKVVVPYISTEKNDPVVAFLCEVSNIETVIDEESHDFHFHTQDLVDLKFMPKEASINKSLRSAADSRQLYPASASRVGKTEVFDTIARDLANVKAICEKIQQFVLAQQNPRLVLGDLPRTEVERTIAQVWSEILGLSQIGMQENFFELGGTSLKAVQVASQLKNALNMELSAIAIFESNTIEELAQHVNGSNGSQHLQDHVNTSRSRNEKRSARRRARRDQVR